MSKRPLVSITVIAYNLANLIDGFLASCKAETCDLLIELHVHSHPEHHKDVIAVCKEWESVANVRVHWHLLNRGLARSWNDGLIAAYDKDGADLSVICNDDTEFGAGDIDKILAFAKSNEAYEAANPDAQKCGMITVCAWHNYYADNPHLGNQPHQGFGNSLFAVTKVGWQTIGCYDVNAFPIYVEDALWNRRLFLSGLCMREVKGLRAIHWGSMSANDAELQKQHAKSSPLNFEYYKRIWGCSSPDPARYMGTETYSFPFNEPAFGLRIPPERADAPYGPLFDRTDFDEVVKR